MSFFKKVSDFFAVDTQDGVNKDGQKGDQQDTEEKSRHDKIMASPYTVSLPGVHSMDSRSESTPYSPAFVEAQ